MDAIDQLRMIATRIEKVASRLAGETAKEARQLADECDALAERIERSPPSTPSRARH
jgi:hypothetical protein